MNIGRWQVLWALSWPWRWRCRNVLPDALPGYRMVFDLWRVVGPVEVRRFLKVSDKEAS